MNKIKFGIAALALVVAAGGAYASAKNFRLVTVYYETATTCEEGTADHACAIGNENCEVLINGSFTDQVFNDRQLKPGSQTLYDCIEPLDEFAK